MRISVHVHRSRPVGPQQVKRRPGVQTDADAEGAVEVTGRHDDDHPFEHGQKFLRHSLLASSEQADHQPDHHHQVEVVERKLAQHLRVRCVHDKNEVSMAPARIASLK